ncbi:MAG: uroporphyrinogen-III synthase, partial [Desulfovibrio sp.]|nr:uroporphyrinogen-III synthase [Desulfovibrio sp.]
PGRYVAEGVLEGLLAREDGDVKGRRFLLPRAARAREVLPDELRRAGAVVDVIPVYETVPAQDRRDDVLERLAAGTLSCVTFGSSSTVENFLSLIPAATLKAHPETRLAAIGPVTAETLRAHGLPCDIMPEEYTIPALVDALQTFFAR